MFKTPSPAIRPAARKASARLVRPALEDLEDRVLLYSTLGAQWTYDSRITYSFMPDGTNVGSTPSSLFATLNAVAPTATWEAQFEQAASLWETAANVNLSLVPDGGEPVGTGGNQQDDPRFGDIRIGAVPLSSGVLAETFLPPPVNGGTDAGDILFNSTANWAVGSTYDVMTVAAHELGHALGLGESTVSSAVMYGTYNGIKQALVGDDIAGIDSIYGAQQYDQFNSNGSRNSSFLNATNITPYINSQSQIALASLDNTTPNDDEWYGVTVPSSTTGQMTVTVQSSNLSSLAPELMVYNSSFSLIASVSAPNTYGATISETLGVRAGQKYYFKVLAASSVAPVGAYGLLVNFGSQSQSPIPPPNTVVGQQPDEGGGVTNNAVVNPSWTTSSNPNGNYGGMPGTAWASMGNLSGWVAMMYAPANASGGYWGGNANDNTRATQATPSIPGDAMGALHGSGTTDAAPSWIGIGPTGASTTSPGPGVATPSTTSDVVFQALDLALEGWDGQSDRTSINAVKPHQS